LLLVSETKKSLLKSLTVWAHKHLFLFQATQVFLLKDTLKEEYNSCGVEFIGIYLEEKETGNKLFV